MSPFSVVNALCLGFCGDSSFDKLRTSGVRKRHAPDTRLLRE